MKERRRWCLIWNAEQRQDTLYVFDCAQTLRSGPQRNGPSHGRSALRGVGRPKAAENVNMHQVRPSRSSRSTFYCPIERRDGPVVGNKAVGIGAICGLVGSSDVAQTNNLLFAIVVSLEITSLGVAVVAQHFSHCPAIACAGCSSSIKKTENKLTSRQLPTSENR
jgi:hypothetical protein